MSGRPDLLHQPHKIRLPKLFDDFSVRESVEVYGRDRDLSSRRRNPEKGASVLSTHREPGRYLFSFSDGLLERPLNIWEAATDEIRLSRACASPHNQ